MAIVSDSDGMSKVDCLMLTHILTHGIIDLTPAQTGMASMLQAYARKLERARSRSVRNNRSISHYVSDHIIPDVSSLAAGAVLSNSSPGRIGRSVTQL